MERKSLYDELRHKGYTRREFLKFCGIMSALLGLQTSGMAQVVDALQRKPRKPVLWYHFQECTCCSESFLRASHPLVSQILMEMISLEYSDTLMAAAGEQAEALREKAMRENYGNYVMVVEGAIPLGSPGYCTIAGRDARTIFEEGAAGAEAIIAWGNCASSGCIQHAHPNPTHAESVTFYGRRIHDTCYRRPAYDAGLFVQSFDDENARKGYCLYYMGCKGPNTFNSCAVIKWNDSVSYPIQSGHGCIGCSEANFWDYGPLYSHIPHVHGIGIEATADKIGAGLSAVAIGGILAHAVATNIQKRNLIKNRTDDLSLNREVHRENESELDREEKEIDASLATLEDDKNDNPQSL